MKNIINKNQLQSLEEKLTLDKKLIDACKKNDCVEAIRLLKTGANPNAKIGLEHYPIITAVLSSNEHMVKVLLAYGADYKKGLEVIDLKGETAEILKIKEMLLVCSNVRAIYNKQNLEVKLSEAGFELLRCMKNLELFDAVEIMLNACRNNFVSVIENLILMGVDLSQKTVKHNKDIGALLLTHATVQNKLEIAKILINNGAECRKEAINSLKQMPKSEAREKIFELVESAAFVKEIIIKKTNINTSELSTEVKELLEYMEFFLKKRLAKACKENNFTSKEAQELLPMLGESLLNSSEKLTTVEKILGKIRTNIKGDKEREILKNGIDQGLKKLITNKSINTILEIVAKHEVDIIIYPIFNNHTGSYANTNHILVYNYDRKTDNFLLTLIHEMTHFAINTKFQNNSKPFFQKINNTETPEFFELAKTSIKEYPQLFEILTSYSEDKYPIELPAFYFGQGLAKDILSNKNNLEKTFGMSELTLTMAGIINEMGCNITDINDVLFTGESSDSGFIN